MTDSEREQQAQHAADSFAVIDPGDVQFRQNDDELVEAVLGDGSVHAGIRVAPACTSRNRTAVAKSGPSPA